jgi:predicted  nucleic acid-binding Zn-ribbon protein
MVRRTAPQPGGAQTAGEGMTARRRAQKARTKIAPARENAQRGKAKASDAGEPLKARLAALERERNALQADLQRAEARIRDLEKTQAEVRDRIAWALDSLHNIMDGKG